MHGPRGAVGRLSGKRVLVTAAAHGIGRACAALFRTEGAEVCATDIDAAGLESLAAPGIETARIDGADPVALQDFFRSAGTFDSVVHCVGYVHSGTVLECGPEDWRRSFSVNVDSFYLLLRHVLPPMVAAGAGSVACIASVASSVKGLPNRAAYGATKAAMIGLVKSVAADFVAKGVRCNAVCPGTITSPSLRQRVQDLGQTLGDDAAAERAFIERQPMGRLGAPEEVAAMCLYLASDESRFVTGQVFNIDGGMTI